MHWTMIAPLPLLRNHPTPGLVFTVNQDGVPSCLRTSVPCMPCAELPRVMGDMPHAIEEALAQPDYAKWRDSLEIE